MTVKGENQRIGVGTTDPASVVEIETSATEDWSTATASGSGIFNPSAHELTLTNTAQDTNESFAGIFFNAGANTSGLAHATARIAAVRTADFVADLAFGTRGASTETNFEKMRLTGAGDLGIGTTTPEAKLDVAGTLKISDDGSSGQAGMIRYNAGTDKFQGYVNDDGSGSPGWVDLH